MASKTLYVIHTPGVSNLFAVVFDPVNSLADYVAEKIALTEAGSPNTGRYSFTADDTNESYAVFQGASVPASWNDYLYIVPTGTTSSGSGGSASVTISPQVLLASQTKLVKKTFEYHNNEEATFVLALSDLNEIESFEGLTLEFVVEDRTREDLFSATDLTTETNTLTIEINTPDPTPPELRPLSWSLRRSDTKQVLGTGPAKEIYAPILDE